MSINNLNTYLNIKDSHLRVVSGNVYAQAMNIGGINVETAHGLQSVSDTGNVTSNTLQFSNATTGFVTTANVEVGGELTVSSNLTVGGNVVADYLYGDGSNISGISSSNLQVVTDTGNVTSNTVQFSNPTTAFKATSNLELTSASKIVVESNVLMDFKTLGQIEFPGSTVEQEYPPRALTGHETLVEGHGVFCTYASEFTLRGVVPVLTWQQAHDLAATLPGGDAAYEPIWYDPTVSTVTAYYGADTASPAVWTNSASTEFASIIASLDDSSRKIYVFWRGNPPVSPTYSLLGYDVADGPSPSLGEGFPNQIFNKNEALTDYWESAASTYTSTSGGSPAVSTSGSERLASNAPYGSWVTLKLPYEICLKRYEFTGAGTKSPKEGQIWGTTDGTTWSHVHTFTGGVTDVKNNETVSGNTNYYSEYAFITTKITGADTVVRIVEIRYFGTPGPTTLDKGSLTLGRSLDVPRVSRYDVDTETPRPEKLVVDFDTTVNSTPTDISGKGNHGVYMTNTAGPVSYSLVDKAFDCTAGNGNIYTGTLTPDIGSDPICSMSAWFKTTNADTTDIQSIMHIGDTSARTLINIQVRQNRLVTGMSINTNHVNDEGVATGQIIESNRWYHVVGVKSGTGALTSSNIIFKLYLDGEEVGTPSLGSGGTAQVNIPSTARKLLVGGSSTSGSGPITGFISNPKLYNVALEASEVQKLYRLGRTGRSMVISDTAVGIGKVPEAQLDVRGVLKCDSLHTRSRVAFAAYVSGGTSSSTSGIFPADSVWYNIGNGYDTSTYLFTAPIHGIYHMSWEAFAQVASSSSSQILAKVNGSYVNIKGNTIGAHGNGMSLDVELKAGDTFNFSGNGSGNPLYWWSDPNHNRFCGYLVFAI